MRPRPALLALLFAALSTVLFVRCSDRTPTDSPPVLPEAETITEADVRARIGILADDSMRGRWTPSLELEGVARYIEGEFRRFGLVPALVNGSFTQRFSTLRDSQPDTSDLSTLTTAPNVIGLLEGGDSRLKDEYVVFVAHMDHVGVRAPEDGDSVYNGADDNASGTAGVLELAEAFAALSRRPARSLIFLLVAGEERGLWGSSYYAQHPAVPLAQTVAAINFDMIGRNSRDSILVTGMQQSSLGEVAARIDREHPELHMRLVDDPESGGLLCCCSDHAIFAMRDVPVLLFFNGLHSDYHRPSDTVDKIDAEKAARILRMAFYLGYDVANRSERPTLSSVARCTGAETASR